MLSENNDFELVAVAPNGQVFRNDDRVAGDRRPLVKVAGTLPGWYTVQVSEFAGHAVDADFTLAFGRYNNGNANCAPATTPSACGRRDRRQGGAVGPRATGGPQDR